MGSWNMDTNTALETLHSLGKDTRVLVQPDDGVLPLLGLIGNAERSVWIKQFTFTHPALLKGVIAAHNPARAARGMMNAPRSSGRRASGASHATPAAAAGQVQRRRPRFGGTREKS